MVLKGALVFSVGNPASGSVGNHSANDYVYFYKVPLVRADWWEAKGVDGTLIEESRH